MPTYPHSRPFVLLSLFSSLSLFLFVSYFYAHKVELQSSLCWVRESLVSSLAIQDESLLVRIHKATSSFFWVELAVFLCGAVQYSVGSELYMFLVFGHVIKNFSKNAISSPRGFWFCTAGSAQYCGKGYSLPSGHAMMYFSALLFTCSTFNLPFRWPGFSSLSHGYGVRLIRNQSWWIRGLLFLPLAAVQAFILFNFLYIGTHTPWDMSVGLAYGAWWFCAWSAAKAWALSPSVEWSKGAHKPAISWWWTTLVLGLFLGTTLALEACERAYVLSVEPHPAMQSQYEAYCGLEPGEGRGYMRITDAYEKTALIGGVCLAWWAGKLLCAPHQSALSRTNSIGHGVRVAWTCWTFHNLKAWLVPVVGKYVHLVLQSTFVFVLLPLIYRVVAHMFPRPYGEGKESHEARDCASHEAASMKREA